MEPNYLLENFIFAGVPFLAYFLGILIRKKARPGRRSPALSDQLLLGIPVSLLIVSPLLPVLDATRSNLPGFLVTIGVIMEHGMLVNETATRHLNKLRKDLRLPAAVPRRRGSAHGAN